MNILFEDRDIIVVVKPEGVESQTAEGLKPDMVNLIRTHLAAGSQGMKEPPYVGVVHRLDKPVSGVMVFAKTKKAAAVLSEQVAAGKFKKHYLAVVCGQIKPPRGHWSDYIMTDKNANISRIVKKTVKGAKTAELNYNTLKKKYIDGEQITLIDIELITGRHHQIRTQLAEHGYPLMGDWKYNPAYLKTDDKGRIVPPEGLCGKFGEKPALCAVSLSFCHPVNRNQLSFECKPAGGVWDIFE